MLVLALTLTLVSVFALCRETVNSSSAFSMMESSLILIVPQASIAHLAKYTVIDNLKVLQLENKYRVSSTLTKWWNMKVLL